MDSTIRSFVKELFIPALPGCTEVYAFHAKRAALDLLVYSFVSLIDRKQGKASIEHPLHQMMTCVSGLGASGLTGLLSLGLCNVTTQLALEGRYEDAFFSGALLIAGRGVVGTGSRALVHYRHTHI
ncbi:hypothetical protein EXS73_02720 [Candidatus Pacearchaeota archaeon]|nr:hypothetical protein [Candidatus Pacearchaeota archaeon]